jgi:hypothetical protein
MKEHLAFAQTTTNLGADISIPQEEEETPWYPSIIEDEVAEEEREDEPATEVIHTAPHNADGKNKDTQPPQMQNPMGSRQQKRMVLSKPEYEPTSFNTKFFTIYKIGHSIMALALRNIFSYGTQKP